MNRLIGFICQIGFRQPQLLIQISPFCWGLSYSYGDKKIAYQIGPLSMALWYKFGSWIKQKYTFEDK